MSRRAPFIRPHSEDVWEEEKKVISTIIMAEMKYCSLQRILQVINYAAVPNDILWEDAIEDHRTVKNVCLTNQHGEQFQLHSTGQLGSHCGFLLVSWAGCD